MLLLCYYYYHFCYFYYNNYCYHWAIRMKILTWGLGLRTVNTKQYDTSTGSSTGETVPVVSVSLTVKQYLWFKWPDWLCYEFLSLTCVVLCLNSLTRMISRIAEPTMATDIDKVNRSKGAPPWSILFPAKCYSRQRGFFTLSGTLSAGNRTRCIIWLAVRGGTSK